MNWSQQINAYCERADFSYWSEPVNAVTNVAFCLVAIWMWRRTDGLLWGRVLSVILFVIGLGSYLFHTHATGWAALMDVVPIAGFILVFPFLVNWHMLRWPLWAALLGTAGFVPYAAGMVVVLRDVPFVQISNFYWTVPVLLMIYAAFLRNSMPKVARGFVVGAAILAVSISFRSVDQTVCESFPLGTHFMWHLLNAVMLGWMIEVYRRHMVEDAPQRG